jgi:hypothetical protein
VTIALIDDQALGRILRGDVPKVLRRRELATTGYWYVRLCQAVLGAMDRPGVLSRPFADLPEVMRDRALSAVLELPDQIGLMSLRELAPHIGRLRQRHALNVLGIEALAAAIRLEAEVFLSARSPRLETALTTEGCRYRMPI